jgi:hypothetical protein
MLVEAMVASVGEPLTDLKQMSRHYFRRMTRQGELCRTYIAAIIPIPFQSRSTAAIASKYVNIAASLCGKEKTKGHLRWHVSSMSNWYVGHAKFLPVVQAALQDNQASVTQMRLTTSRADRNSCLRTEIETVCSRRSHIYAGKVSHL